MRTKRLDLVIAGLLLLGMAAGCQERNPAYITPKQDAAFGPEATPDLPGAPDAAPDVVLGPEVRVDAPLGVETGPDHPRPPLDVAVDVTVDQGAADGSDVAADTRDSRRPDDAIDVGRSDDGRRDTADLSPPGDARDVPVVLTDGPSDTGAFEAAPADVAPLCSEGSKRDCAAPGNPLIGACHAGQQKCTGGAWGACEGEILPANAEVCDNGIDEIDDDCNGMTDEGCLGACVVVAPAGNDLTADGTTEHPFGTVAAGLAFAAAVDGGSPRQVCVAAGTGCGEPKTYALNTALAIPNGARLQGNYALDGTTLKYCGDTQPPVTALQFTTAAGAVVFGAGVTAATEVSGFVIERYSSSAGTVDAPVTGVSVQGGQKITLSGIFIIDAPLGQTTHGVDVESGGQVTITRSSIGGGNGSASAVGVFVGGGSVVLRDNCDEAAGAMCPTGCAADGVLGIRGRVATGGDTAAASSAVYVTGNAAASTIIANTLCGGTTGAAADVSAVGAAGLRCEKGNCATVSGNFIEGSTGRFSVGVVLSGGGGMLAGNAIQPACASEAVLGVVLEGSAARLENNRVLPSACAANQAKLFRGLQVVLGATGGGPDVHSNVIDPGGRSGECQSTGIDVSRVEVDAVSAGVFRNNIVSAGTCGQRIAIVEQEKATAQSVENNDLYAPPLSGQNIPAVLYRRGGTDATTAEQVNKLEGAVANISADPQFVSYPTDLHLTAASPCLDQGTAAGAPATDGDGRARPQRAGFDIGAYELPAP